jgi:Carbohydrate binding module (family 6)
VSVTMSDGSTFSGTLSITEANSGGFHLSGNTLQEKASGGTPPGTYHDFNVVATEANISNSPQQVSPTVTGVVEAPFGGSARPITNVIQAEDYDLGGQGVAYNTTETCGAYPSDSYRGVAGDGVNIDTTSDAGGGGYKLGCNKAGDWHNYTITVSATGTYTLNMRTANIEAGATYRVAIDGAIVVSGIAVPNTGSYDTFATVTSKQFGLTAGQHVMQIVLDAAGSSGYGGDFNWVQGTLVKAGAIGAKNVDIIVTH